MPFEQGLEQLPGRTVIETPLTFLQKQPKMSLRDPIVAPQVTFGLVPKVLDAINMSSFTVREPVLMVNSVVPEARHIKRIIADEAVGIDDRVWLDPLFDDGHQRAAFGVRNHHCVDTTAALEDAKDGHLTGGTAPTFSLTTASKVTFIDLDFAFKGVLDLDVHGDRFTQFMVVEGSRVAINADEFSCGAGRGASDEVFNESSLFVSWQFATSSLHRTKLED